MVLCDWVPFSADSCYLISQYTARTKHKQRSCRVGLSDEVEAEIARLRAQLLEKERQHELVACQLEAERVEREKAQRKVDGLTRLMLEGGREAVGAEQGKGAAFDRRLTWCPGKQQGTRRRGTPVAIGILSAWLFFGGL